MHPACPQIHSLLLHCSVPGPEELTWQTAFSHPLPSWETPLGHWRAGRGDASGSFPPPFPFCRQVAFLAVVAFSTVPTPAREPCGPSFAPQPPRCCCGSGNSLRILSWEVAGLSCCCWSALILRLALEPFQNLGNWFPTLNPFTLERCSLTWTFIHVCLH